MIYNHIYIYYILYIFYLYIYIYIYIYIFSCRSLSESDAGTTWISNMLMDRAPYGRSLSHNLACEAVLVTQVFEVTMNTDTYLSNLDP